jgi:hypothetical protein
MTEVVASSEDEQKVLRSTRTSNKLFEVSRSEKSWCFVDVVKDKRTKNNNL